MNAIHIAKRSLMSVVALGAATVAHAQDATWVQKVSKLVTANYTYPRSAQVRGEEGRALIKVTVSATGQVLSVDLVQPTGSAILDREAVRIPTRIGAFPVPPKGGTSITIPITWRLG